MKRRAFLGGAAASALLARGASAEAPPIAPKPRTRPPLPVLTATELAAAADLTGVVAFIVVDLATGEVLEEALPDLPLPPASVAKIPTALYVLDTLGPEYRFETRVAAVGPRTGGVLNGDLILQGGGDPELDTADLNRLAEELAARGLKQVSGRFLVDANLLPAIDRIDADQPDDVQYNTSIGALNLNFNRVYVAWRREEGVYRTAAEARADGLTVPTAQARLEPAPRTETDRFDYALEGDVEVWRATRTRLDRSGEAFVPTRRPADYAARTFRELARRSGLSLPSHEVGAAPVVAEVLARTQSRPVVDIVRAMMRYSTNMTAEALGLAATRARGGAAFALSDSAGAMNAWAAAYGRFPAGDGGMRLVNHSGLSIESRASVRRVVQLLAEAHERPLPQVDESVQRPTVRLRSVLKKHSYSDRNAPNPKVDAEMRAKTGSLDFVNALAGYIDVAPTPAAPSGRNFAFAFIAADVERRRNAQTAGGDSPPGAEEFAAKARRLQRAMARSWITRFGV